MAALDPVRASVATLRRAVANPNLRRLQVAWALSVTGNWAYGIAISVFAYRAGGAALVGVGAMLRILPSAIAAPFAGALADRWPRKRVMIASDVSRALLLGLAAAAALAHLGIVPVFVFGALAAVPSVAFAPARSALLPELVDDPEDLVAANAAFSTFEGLGFFAGPALGGLLVALTSPGVVFLATAATLVTSAALVAGISSPRDRRADDAEEGAANIGRRVLDGLRAMGTDARLRLVLLLVSAQTLVCGVLNVIVVVLAFRSLHVGDKGVGWLMSAVAIGGIAGAAFVSGLVGRGRLAGGFAVGLALWGAPLVAIGLAPTAAVAVAALVVTGVANTLVDVASFTLLQRVAPPELLARVFGALESLIIGTIALGGVLAPPLVALAGVTGAFVVAGAFLPVIALVTWPMLRRLELPAPAALGLLRASSIFARLDAPVVERLAGELLRTEVAAGDAVFFQGDPGDRVYLIESGSVEVEVDGRPVRRQERGEQFGEIALLRDVPRTATVRAAEATVLQGLDRDSFLDAVGGNAASSREAEALSRSRLAWARPALGSV